MFELIQKFCTGSEILYWVKKNCTKDKIELQHMLFLVIIIEVLFIVVAALSSKF